MNIVTRRIIFWTFVVLFFVLTIYFSLLASGYVLSLSDIRSGNFINLQRTGILALNSIPRSANVYLTPNFRTISLINEALPAKTKTPVKIKNLHPGEYLLELELEGYWPFQQEIVIHPGQTTYLETINILRRSLPYLILNSDIEELEFCDNDSLIRLKESKQIFDIEREVLIEGDCLVNEALDYTYLEGITKDEIVRDSLESPSFLFVLYIKDEEQFLSVFDDNSDLLRSFQLPSNSNYELLSYYRDTLLLKNNDLNTLYILNPFARTSVIRDRILNVDNISFINSNIFIYSHSSNIYLFDIDNLSSNLLVRFQGGIDDLLWHNADYIIFSTDNTIKALDLKHDKRVTDLFEFDELSNLLVDSSNNVLYFTARIGSQEGLHKLFIQ